MDAFTSLVSDITPTINDFLNCRGGQVSNLALSLINRARFYLWQYKPWSYLRASEDLVLDSNQESDLPDTFGRVHKITDNSTTLYPVYSFNHTNKTLRYEFVNTVDTEAGITQKIKFFNGQPSVHLVYIQKFEKVAEEDNYLLFPSNLVIRAAEWIHAADAQQKDSTISSLERILNNEINQFQNCFHDDNTQIFIPQRDYYGTDITNESINLVGD